MCPLPPPAAGGQCAGGRLPEPPAGSTGSRTARRLHIPVPTEVNERDGILLTARENDRDYARQWICQCHGDGMADRWIDDDSESCARPLPMEDWWRGIIPARENGRERDAGRCCRPVGVAWPRTGAGIFVGANLAVTAAPPALRSSPLAQFATLAFSALPFPRSAGPAGAEPARGFRWARQRDLWLPS